MGQLHTHTRGTLYYVRTLYYENAFTEELGKFKKQTAGGRGGGAEGGNVKFMQNRHLEVDFALHGEEPQQEISLTEAQNKNKVRA